MVDFMHFLYKEFDFALCELEVSDSIRSLPEYGCVCRLRELFNSLELYEDYLSHDEYFKLPSNLVRDCEV